MTLCRVDTVLPELLSGPEPVYLKLDTQGSELAILRGASNTLTRTVLVEAELSLVPLYRDGPLFDEEPETGHMLQFDAIFLHR